MDNTQRGFAQGFLSDEEVTLAQSSAMGPEEQEQELKICLNKTKTMKQIRASAQLWDASIPGLPKRLRAPVQPVSPSPTSRSLGYARIGEGPGRGPVTFLGWKHPAVPRVVSDN